MNIRMTIGILLLVFAYPICNAILKINGEDLLKYMTCLCYMFDATYLIATGYNISTKGKPW